MSYLDDLDGQRLYAPILPTLEAFAREAGLTLSYVGEEDLHAGPHYQLGWANTDGQMCFLTVNMWLDPHPERNRLKLNLMRWGVHGLIGGKTWELPPGAAAEELQAALKEAVRWSNEPVP